MGEGEAMRRPGKPEPKVPCSPLVSSWRRGSRRRGRGRTSPRLTGEALERAPRPQEPGPTGLGCVGERWVLPLPLWPPAMRKALGGTWVGRAGLGEPSGGREGTGSGLWSLEGV